MGELKLVESDRPLDALNASRGKRVIVELKNGKQFIGRLVAFDIHINTVLDEAEERENNELKRKIGRVFIRGDTIVFISPE
ncbi:MAG: LSm family protein [Nanoarchaeota archaeon]